MSQAEENAKPQLNENGIPPFESLPLRKGDPKFSAWGLYGDDDQLGTLNRLTDETVLAAAKSEIRTGARFVFTVISTSSHFPVILFIPRRVDR